MGSFNAYYCPLALVIRNNFPDEAQLWLKAEVPLTVGIAEFVKRFEKWSFRYVIILWVYKTLCGKQPVKNYEVVNNVPAIQKKYITGTSY